MNVTNFKFTRKRPPNTPEEAAKYPSCPPFIRDGLIDVDRACADPDLMEMGRVEYKIGYLNGRASFCFGVTWTRDYRGKKVELLHNPTGECVGVIEKKSRKVIAFTETERSKLARDPKWSHFCEKGVYP